jgi:UPF0755 protein
VFIRGSIFCGFKQLKTLKRIFFTVLLLGILAGSLSVRWFDNATTSPGPLAAAKLVYIPPGIRTKGMAAKLLDAGVIDSDLAFRLDARLQGRLEGLKAGEYQFQPRMSIADVIVLLQSGKTYQHKITIPEGLMSVEIVALLNKEPVLTGVIDPLPPEGSLLPETYKFSYGDTRQSVISRMKKSMQDAMDALWQKRAADFPLTEPETIVLASIVEKETGVAAERPRVAGVFLNRLKKGIPLQSDPTVIYALTLGQSVLNRPLTTADLKKPSPYNTYLASGLPPAPIANPGKASLAAVLNPEKNDYIYFVADGSGGHAFATTLEEHNRNVAKWRALKKNSN